MLLRIPRKPSHTCSGNTQVLGQWAFDLSMVSAADILSDQSELLYYLGYIWLQVTEYLTGHEFEQNLSKKRVKDRKAWCAVVLCAVCWHNWVTEQQQQNTWGFPGGSVVKNAPANERDAVKKICRGRKWQPTPVFLPGESHGQWSLMGYSPWDHKGFRHDLMTKQKQQNTHLVISLAIKT